MSYGNYVQGNVDTNANAYNLLISGAPSGYTSSGINIGGDTSTTYGVKISNDSSNNAFMDLRGDASNKIAFRYKDQSSGTVTAMLELTNDSSLTGNGYGATVNGRVNASSYYVGQVDTRAPTSSGVYMGTDGNVGYFNMNKGSGTGGFAFNSYNSNGSLLQNNMNLLASGIVQASYYTATGNSDDTESIAISGFDASGNLVRNYAANARFRSIESRLSAAESSVSGPVSSKVNEVITRLNGLNFFSQPISTIAANGSNSSPSPAPSPPATDPTLVYYYPTKTGDVSGTQLADYASGTKTFNATLSATGMASSTNPGGSNSGSILLSGSNFISLPSLTIPSFESTSGGVSFSVWVKASSLPSTLNVGYSIFEFSQNQNSGSLTPSSYMVNMTYTYNNNILISMSNSATQQYYNAPLSSVSITDWTHLVWTMDNSGVGQSSYNTETSGWKLYINGSPVSLVYQWAGLGTIPYSYPPPGNYPYVLLGKTNFPDYNGSGFFQGNIANFRFYNKLLSSSNVATLYNQLS